VGGISARWADWPARHSRALRCYNSVFTAMNTRTANFNAHNRVLSSG